MKRLAGAIAIAAVMAVTPTANAGVLSHFETCTEATVSLVGFPSRGIHTIYAYFGGDATGQVAKSFTGTSATVRFPVPQGGVLPGETYSVLYSWRGSMGGTKPGTYSFTCEEI